MRGLRDLVSTTRDEWEKCQVSQEFHGILHHCVLPEVRDNDHHGMILVLGHIEILSRLVLAYFKGLRQQPGG